MNSSNPVFAKTCLKGLLKLLIVFVLLGTSACTSNRYNGRNNWHRSPASTGRNKCGCMNTLPEFKIYGLNISSVYVFQA